MKKAKILVPAIAALVLSSAAAVTGTVAWFTSNLSVKTAQGATTVVNASSGNLVTKSITAVYGCTANETTGVTMKTLVDGSVDVAKDTVYNKTADNTYVTVSGAVGPTTNEGATFRAAKYTIQFGYTFYNSVESTANLDVTAAYQECAKTLAPAYRIAFKTSTATKVFAPYRADSYTSLKFVDAESGAAKGSYSDDQLYNKAGTNVIGTFTRTTPGSEVTLDVDVYVWIEGEDDACKNTSTLLSNEASAELTFKATLA